MSNIQTYLQKILSARYGKDVRQSIHDAIEEIDKVADTAQGSATEAAKNAISYAEQAQRSAANAAISAEQAQSSASSVADNTEQAQNSAFNAASYAEQAQRSESNVASYAEQAQSSATNAASYAEQVRMDVQSALSSAEQAQISASNAATSAEQAQNSTTMASEYEIKAEQYKNEAEQYKNEAKQYRDESEFFVPDGYSELVKNVADNTFKIDTVIGNIDLGIKNTASGEDIHLTDSADGKVVDFALYGKAKQNTTIGKNILQFSLDGVVELLGDSGMIVNKRSGKMTINGTTEKSYRFEDQFNNSFIPKVTGIYLLTGSSTDNCRLCIYGDDLGNVYTDETKTVIQMKDQGATNKEVPFYLEAGVTYHLNYFLSKATFDNDEICPMLRLAGTDDTFEPYTGGIPSPNPDYPQEIEASGASGSVVVKSCGKNHLKTTSVSTTIGGITYTVHEDKSISVNGILTASLSAITLNSNIAPYLKKGEKYIVSGSSSKISCAIKLTANGSFLIENYNGVSNSFTYDGQETVKIELVIRGGIDAVIPNTTFYPMIRHVIDTDDTYEPYKETTATMQTPNGYAGIPVSSGGNHTDKNGQQWICDEIVKYADGTGEKIQRIKKVVLNGNETWKPSGISGGEHVFYSDAMLDAPLSTNPVLCDRYIFNGWAVADMPDKTLKQSASSNGLSLLYLCDTSFSTPDELKTFLAENNSTCYYILATPIRTPLTAAEIAEIEKLQTFYPVTNLSNDGDCEMKVTYLADSKNYIDNQLALQAQAQEAAMINMLLLLPEETQAAMIENDTNNLLIESEE